MISVFPYPSGPKGHLLSGNLPSFQKDRLSLLLSLPAYGDITYLRLGRESVYAIHHPALIRQVLVEQADKYQKLRLTRRLFNQTLRGASDAQLRKTEAWKHRREIVQNAFHATHVHDYVQGIVAETSALLNSDAWQPGHTLNIYEQMRTLTLNIAAHVLFGSALSPEHLNEVLQATATLQLRASKRFNAFLALPMWFPTSENTRIKRAVKTLDQIIEGIIEDCASHENLPTRTDLVAMLVHSQEQLQIDAIREELISLLISSHETTATALAWTFYLLAQNVEVASSVHAELDQVLGQRHITMQDRLPYLDAVIKEAMRLYPPSWVISRRAVQDVELGGYTVPKGSLIYIVPYSLHRDERWFADANRFDPERFLTPNNDPLKQYHYLPFGTGPRKCIGSSFAMLEITLILATVLQQAQFTLVPGQRIVPDPLITLRPKYGIRLKVSVRNG